MTVHHLISEDHSRNSCPYCGKDTEMRHWRSVFDLNNAHYKECDCSCGKKVMVKVPFIGSGHDSWNKNLDMRVAEAEKSRKD